MNKNMLRSFAAALCLLIMLAAFGCGGKNGIKDEENGTVSEYAEKPVSGMDAGQEGEELGGTKSMLPKGERIFDSMQSTTINAFVQKYGNYEHVTASYSSLTWIVFFTVHWDGFYIEFVSDRDMSFQKLVEGVIGEEVNPPYYTDRPVSLSEADKNMNLYNVTFFTTRKDFSSKRGIKIGDSIDDVFAAYKEIQHSRISINDNPERFEGFLKKGVAADEQIEFCTDYGEFSNYEYVAFYMKDNTVVSIEDGYNQCYA